MESITSIITTLGFPSLESFLGALFLILAVIGAVVVISTVKPVLDIFPYTYPNARVRARMGRLFTEKQLSEVIEAENLDEVKNYLAGVPEYTNYIDKYPLEKALDTQLAETYNLVARIVPDSIKEVFRVLLRKWDIRNIKSIITAKEAALSREETMDLLVPFGELSEILDRLVDAKNITELITSLEGTDYAPILEDALPAYQKTKMILPLEASLDKYLLDRLLKAVMNPYDENTTILHSYIGTQVDATNIKIILRSKVDGLKFEDIQPYMTLDGYQVREWKLKDLMEAPDVEGVVSGLEGTDYAQTLAEALPEYSKTGSIAPLEVALDNYIMKVVKTLSRKKPFGVGPIIGFLNKKEIEVKNLKVIVRGKREGFSASKIRELLI